MAWFALTNAARIAMVLIVVGSWGGLAQVATALMRQTYNAGLITLRTAPREKRRARLSRVVATAWMYAIVFIILSTSFVGMGILMKDTADFFGFQKHILSWEYVLHPKFVALVCACGLAASAVAVARFRRAKVMNAAAYDSACRLGFAVFMGTAAVGFAFILVLEAARVGGGGAAASAMPSGRGVTRALAVLAASRAPLAGFGGFSTADAQDFIDGYLKDAGVPGKDTAVLKNFVSSLPVRVDVVMESLESRMRAKGFDAATSRDAAAELRAAVVRMRKSGAPRKQPTAEQLEAVPGLKKLAEKDAGAASNPSGLRSLLSLFGPET